MDLGGFLLSDGLFSIQHYASGDRHRLELRRRVKTRNWVPARWETTDVVELTLTPKLFLCLTPARAADGAEVIVIAREDEGHEARHAWRLDADAAKLVVTDPKGLVCDLAECHDEDE